MAARQRHHRPLFSDGKEAFVKALRRMWSRRRGAILGHGDDHELSAEVAFHYEMLVEENVRAGMSKDEARRQARLNFGSFDSVKENYRDQRGLVWLAGVL